MTGSQIAALIFALLLLLPGGCFLVFGISFVSDPGGGGSFGAIWLVIAAAILSFAGFLFWVAIRRRRTPPE